MKFSKNLNFHCLNIQEINRNGHFIYLKKTTSTIICNSVLVKSLRFYDYLHIFHFCHSTIVIGEILKTPMGPQNEVDKYPVAVVDHENNITDHLPKGKSEKYEKTIFYFLRSDPLNICHAKITGKAVHLRGKKEM